MKELSLHILDIVENSINAGATEVEIQIVEDNKQNLMTITIVDNGKGMDEKMLEKVLDPFFTTRTTRKVGLGLPLFAQAAKMAGGDLKITSKIGLGTKVEATFIKNHIDLQPLGNMAETLVTLCALYPNVDFIYKHLVDDRSFVFDTKEIKERLKDVPINNPLVLGFIKDYVESNLKSILEV
ncbi:MAG: ATP-binding protein [Thermovenabulum sp.]|uniref:ATP-binding protein n=1 Tax=Thermovenabulum sp. TaxID=3100335 RepID=UPI003C7B3E34